MNSSALEYERVRRHTPPPVNRKIDATIRNCVRRYALADEETISRRIHALEREWDIEQALEVNAASVALAGIALALRDRRWLALPAVVLGFLLQHGTQGWCPPLPVFRRLGVRTRTEIERERFVLKFLRGDFDEFDRSRARRRPDTLVALAAR